MGRKRNRLISQQASNFGGAEVSKGVTLGVGAVEGKTAIIASKGPRKVGYMVT